ncbi:MAG: hypothetical protein E7163_00485 [Firmicutes bacterium]|nr:hypothetical protein [Bacillota bacterium]
MKNIKIYSIIILIIMTSIVIIKTQASKTINLDSSSISEYNNKEVAIYQENDSGSYDLVSTLPSKSNGYIINKSKTVCSNKAKIRWDNNTWSATISNFSVQNTKCYLYFDKTSTPKITIKATSNGSSIAFPSKTSGYIPNSISCDYGVKASFDYENWNVEVDVIKDTVCTVDFKSNINQSFATYLTSSIVCSSTPTSDDAAKNCLVNESGYRYEGINPNNYVLFNNELWRIIGVFNINNSAGTAQNLVKIIRDKNLEDLAFDSGNNNDWSNSSLKKQLNEGFYSRSTQNCNIQSTITKPCNFENKGLNTTAQNMVEEVKWNIGKYSNIEVKTSDMYNFEIASNGPGKVGLMSASDYGYSVLNSSCDRETKLTDYAKTTCAGNSWLYQDGYQRIINSNSNNETNSAYIHNGGHINDDDSTEGYGVRPVVYLKSTVKVLGGAGTSNLPYIITN